MVSLLLIKLLQAQRIQKGFSLFELLIGTALSGLVLALLAGLFQPALKLSEFLKIRKQEFYTLLRVEALLREAMEGVDTHRLAIFPIIHLQGALRYADGTEHPLRFRQDLLSPQPTSDSLTWVSVHTQSLRWASEIQEVRKVDEKRYEIDLEECSSTDRLIPAEERSLIGLSPDGIFELQVLARTIAEPCAYYRLLLTKSMILPNRVADGRTLLTLRALLSVKEIGTVYLDRGARLRFLTHNGEEILENQPILEEVKELRLQFTSLANDTARVLDAKLSFPSGRDQVMSFSHHLARRSPLEMLFLARLL